jgi:O-acetyl-ADP-ribose deacetylase (regulator of RNase III)
LAIKFVHGNILESTAEGLVNPTNARGPMGKGLALTFKLRYPGIEDRYKWECKLYYEKTGTWPAGRVCSFAIGHLDPVHKRIYCLSTKDHWQDPSQLSYIQSGLVALRTEVGRHKLRSIALPKLGCGEGKLDWLVVRPIVTNTFLDTKFDVLIYE